MVETTSSSDHTNVRASSQDAKAPPTSSRSQAREITPDEGRANPEQRLKRTPLYDIHVALGAKIVPFAGFEMPVQYPTGITAEHKAVREKAGLFDVSHMGEFMVRGPQAVEFVNYVTTNDVAALAPGQAQYSTILREDGTIVDDCLVYRAEDRVLMVVNGSNIDKDFAHISRFVGKFNATLEDISDTIALLALQGPDAARILQRHTDTDLSNIKYYEFITGKVAGVDKVYISRTGYTGEDGFELYFPGEHAEKLWNALTASGEVTPAGLGARVTILDTNLERLRQLDDIFRGSVQTLASNIAHIAEAVRHADLLVGGVLILLIEWSRGESARATEMTWTMAVAVGIAQLLAAVFPGTSRAAATILIAVALGLKRPAATEFSFLLGIPTLFAASAYEIYRELKHPGGDPIDWPMVALGTAVSAVVAFLVVRWILRWIQTHTFIVFGWYRIALGLLMVAVAYRSR